MGKGYVKGNIRRHYNVEVHIIVWQIVEQLIMHKNPNYYMGYLKIKNDLTNRHHNYPRYKIDAMTRNRIGTFLLKDIYDRFNDRRITFPEEIENSDDKVFCGGREMTIKEVVKDLNSKIKKSPPHTLIVKGHVKWVGKGTEERSVLRFSPSKEV